MSRLLCATAAVLVVVACRLDADPAPATDRLNKKIDNFTLTAADGKHAGLHDLKDRKAVVVVFLSFDCPVSNHYATTLAEMHASYSGKGVSFLGVVAGDDTAADVAKKAAAFKLPFPVHADPTLAAAEALKATTTPEAFVLDHNFVLRYRGRIDNSFAARLKKNPRVTDHDLRDALDALLAGQPVMNPATRAVGCPITAKDVKPAADAGVSYHRDVVPILQQHCQSCHRPGEVGPFSLMTYKQAVNWASDVTQYTHDRKMPPWKPTAGAEFKNTRSLSDKQIATLAAWEKAGCPEGDPKDAPPPMKFPDGWQLGEPDLVLTPEEDMHVAAGGADLFRCFVLPTGLTEDKYIVAYEVKPGNAAVVHHALNFFDTTGNARKLLDREKAKAAKNPNPADHGPGYSVAMGIGFIPLPADAKPGIPPIGSFGGWAPGQLGTRFPEGTGYYLPKEADVILQVHYHRTGKPEADRPKIGLYFAKKPVEKRWQTLAVGEAGNPLFPLLATNIPAGKPDHVIKRAAWLTADANLHSVLPHMHLIGRSIKVTMTPPGGEPVVLVDIKDWDYNWQETYWFKEPIRAKAGTRLEVEGVYDNSTSNPNNPNNPPQVVLFGEQTSNEMLFGFIGATPVGKERLRLSRMAPAGGTE
jgi:peroxiredoxin